MTYSIKNVKNNKKTIDNKNNPFTHYDEWLAVALYEAGRKPKGSEFTIESLFDPDLWEMIKRRYMIYRPFERDFDELVALTAGSIKRVDDKDGVPTYVNVKGPVKGGPVVVNPCCYLLWLTSLTTHVFKAHSHCNTCWYFISFIF